MTKFIKNYIVTRSLWVPLPLLFLVLTERSIDALSKDTFSMLVAGALVLIVMLLENIVGSNRGRVAVKNSMNLSILLYLLGGILYYFEIYQGLYGVLFLLVLLNRRSSNNIYHMLDMGVKFNNKPKVNRTNTLIASILMVTIYATAYFTGPLHYLYIIGLLSLLLTKVSFNTCVKMWDNHSTTEHLILSQQQKNAHDVAIYRKPTFKLKDSIKVKGLIRSFYIYLLCITTIPFVTTIFAHDYINKNQSFQIGLLTLFLLGNAISAPFQSYIVSRVRSSYMVQNSILFIGLYTFVLYKQASVWYLSILIFLLGLLYQSVVLGVEISIKQSIKQGDVEKQLKIFKVLNKLIPILSFTAVIITYKYYTVDYILIGVSFLCMTIIILLSTLRLFRPRVKDMKYVRYR